MNIVCPKCKGKPTLDDDDLKGCFNCDIVWTKDDYIKLEV